jgi:capsular polysaccharide transport system permease protein
MTSPSTLSAAPQQPAPARAQAPRSRRFKFLRVTTALMLREISSTDSRTSLGFLWQLIEPIATVTLLTIFFQMMTRTPPLGTNYPLFYVTGVLPFSVFSTVGNKVSGAVRYSKPLLEFPSVSVIDAILARFMLNFVIECAVFVILTSSIIGYYHLKVIINIPMAVEAMMMAGALALGVGTFNSVLFVAYPVYETIYSVITRPLMLISGVLFVIKGMPEPVRSWMQWNPVSHPVAMMRAAFFPGADVTFVSPMYIALISMVAFTFGLVTLRRFFRDALER